MPLRWHRDSKRSHSHSIKSEKALLLVNFRVTSGSRSLGSEQLHHITSRHIHVTSHHVTSVAILFLLKLSSNGSRASTYRSEMEDYLASESETEDEQVKTGEGKGKGSAMATRSRSRTPTSQRSPSPSPAHLRMMATLIEVGTSDLAAAWIVADRSLRRRFFVASEARGSVGREMRRAAALGVK